MSWRALALALLTLSGLAGCGRPNPEQQPPAAPAPPAPAVRPDAVQADPRAQQQAVELCLFAGSEISRLAQYDAWQLLAAQRHELDWLLGKAVRIKESFNLHLSVSSTGAVGLMQLMPTYRGKAFRTKNYHRMIRARRSATRSHRGKGHRYWSRAYQHDLNQLVRSTPQHLLYARDQRFDPRWNIFESTRELSSYLTKYRKRYPKASPQDRVRMALAAYYAGAGHVKYRNGKVVLTYRLMYVYAADTLEIRRRLSTGMTGREQGQGATVTCPGP